MTVKMISVGAALVAYGFAAPGPLLKARADLGCFALSITCWFINNCKQVQVILMKYRRFVNIWNKCIHSVALMKYRDNTDGTAIAGVI